MKIILPGRTGKPGTIGSRPRCRNERGFFAVIVMITLLAIMLIYIASNTHVLGELHQQLRLVEQKQLQRTVGSQTPENTTLQSPTNQTGQLTNAPSLSPVSDKQRD